MPYCQEGRQAIVYKLVDGRAAGQGVAAASESLALKVFEPMHRLPALVSLSEGLGRFEQVPGLGVCRRGVITTRNHPDLLTQQPDLIYSVVMPWVEGPTWREVLLEKPMLSWAQCFDMVRAFLDMLTYMEEHGLAHCDLSAPNVIVPALASSRVNLPLVCLVDVEQLYGPGLLRPEQLPAGSPGYAHATARDGLWSANADRFAGALLVSEMLGWCEPRVREAAWGESFFDPAEMGGKSSRFHVLGGALAHLWGEKTASLLQRAWESGSCSECPTFGEETVSKRMKASPSAEGKGELQALLVGIVLLACVLGPLAYYMGIFTRSMTTRVAVVPPAASQTRSVPSPQAASPAPSTQPAVMPTAAIFSNARVTFKTDTAGALITAHGAGGDLVATWMGASHSDLTISLKPGVYFFKITRPHYHPIEFGGPGTRLLNVEASRTLVLDAPWLPLPSIVVTTNRDARILLNGKAVGKTQNRKLVCPDLSLGSYSVVARRQGCHDVPARLVNIQAKGQVVAVSLTLKQIPPPPPVVHQPRSRPVVYRPLPSRPAPALPPPSLRRSGPKGDDF